VNPYDKSRLAHLRAQLAAARIEKQSLVRQIHSLFTEPLRKHMLERRYSAVNAELRSITTELEELIAAIKSALAGS
jgi:hypothetical protein